MKIGKSILSLILAMLVLFSSTSFMVGYHLCMGELKDVALFSKGECEMERNAPPCHRHVKTSCCDDETIVHDADDFKLSLSDVSVQSPQFLMIQLPVLIAELIPSNERVTFYLDTDDPPRRALDVTVDYRVLII